MTALAVAEMALTGSAAPRIAPPTPARSDLDGFRTTATELGITLMPWQETVGRYLEALGPDDRHLYREVGIVVARQNGKTKILVPLIVKRLLAGARVMHTAQDRSLPREVFYEVAEIIWSKHPELFPQRNGRPTKPRYANGQEEVRLTNGGIYSIVAPTRGGARGPSRDLVIVDELREMDTWDFIAAAKPTMTAAPDPQMVYLSNAGEEDSIVLNALRDRASSDPSLAYLEWSAAPERTADDPVGWTESNPALGHEAEGMGSLQVTLETDYRTAKLEGTLAIYETEHLCRWVVTMRRPLVNAAAWNLCEVASLPEPHRPVMGISMDPSGRRASAVIAWRQNDESIALRQIYDVVCDTSGVDRLGRDLRADARRLGVTMTAFDPLTDAHLARFLPRKEPIGGKKYANASARFVETIEAGKLAWNDCAAVGDDLTWASRLDGESGSFEAVRSNDDRPITAVHAAIRAVWLASYPRPTAMPHPPSTVGF